MKIKTLKIKPNLCAGLKKCDYTTCGGKVELVKFGNLDSFFLM